MYDLLFSCVNDTLQRTAASEFGCKMGLISTLHTWGQRMKLHVHIHVVHTAGGLSLDGERWVPISGDEPAMQRQALAAAFKKTYLRRLKTMLKQGKVEVPPGLDDSTAADELIEQLSGIDWIVDSKPTPPELRGTDAAINYVARYICGAAIGNRRMISDDGKVVKFRYYDYATGEERIEAIPGEEFTGRFALHVLPKSFSRVRHSGLFQPCGRDERLAKCRAVTPGVDGTEEEALALTIELKGGCDPFSPAGEEESFVQEEEEEEDSGKPKCSCCEKAMSFARRLEGEMTLQLLALSTRIVLRMMAGSRASFDVLVNLAMTSTRPPGGGWLSMKGDDWEMLSSLIQTKLRDATAEMEPDAIPEAVKGFLINPHPPPGSRRKVNHAAA